jgi:hypothetical protein
MRTIIFDKRREDSMTDEQREYFNLGVESVTSIRCMGHRAIGPLNDVELGGGECPICEIERLQSEASQSPKSTPEAGDGKGGE